MNYSPDGVRTDKLQSRLFSCDMLRSWEKNLKDEGWRQNSGFKSVKKHHEGRKTLRQHRFSGDHSTTTQSSRLFYWQLLVITVGFVVNFPCLKRSEGIPPMRWYRVFSSSNSLLCLPMRAISFHTWLVCRLLQQKQCGRFLRAGWGRKFCRVPENGQPLRMRLYSSWRRPPA